MIDAMPDPIPAPNEWATLPDIEHAVSMFLLERDDGSRPFREIIDWYGHGHLPKVIQACVRLRDKHLVDFAGINPQMQVIRFIGQEQKRNAEMREERMQNEPLSNDELKLLDKILECCPAVGDCFNGTIVTGLGFNLHFSDQETNTMFSEMKEKKAVEYITGGLYSVPPKGRDAVLNFRRNRLAATELEPAAPSVHYTQIGGEATMNFDQRQNHNRDGVQNIAGGDQKIATGDGNVIGDDVRIMKPEAKPRWLAKVLTEKALWIIGCLLLAVFVYWLKHPAK